MTTLTAGVKLLLHNSNEKGSKHFANFSLFLSDAESKQSFDICHGSYILVGNLIFAFRFCSEQRNALQEDIFMRQNNLVEIDETKS